MAQEIDPGRTSRAAAFAAWMGAPMPMVTLTGTFDAGRLLRLARRGFKFNMLLCWCIGQAASQIPEFYLLPVDGKLLRYDKLAVNVVVATRAGGIATCDVPFSGNLARFNRVLHNLCTDVWTYISMGYFRQIPQAGATGRAGSGSVTSSRARR